MSTKIIRLQEENQRLKNMVLKNNENQQVTNMLRKKEEIKEEDNFSNIITLYSETPDK